MKFLRAPKLNFNQKMIIAVLILSLFYVGSYIYEQYRLTVEHNANILKWCMIHARDFHGKDSNERLKRCEQYFGKYHLPFRNKNYKKDNTF